MSFVYICTILQSCCYEMILMKLPSGKGSGEVKYETGDSLSLNQNHHLDSGLLTCTLPPSFTAPLRALVKNFKG